MLDIETERSTKIIDKIDLTKFTIKENKRFDEIEHRGLGSNKPFAKTLEVMFTANFNYDVLATV
jgi:hypothetical protein